tara:strand:+ start:5335 stop:5778 length:444 start_codon:yes stop_codon:yes gene_type:complete
MAHVRKLIRDHITTTLTGLTTTGSNVFQTRFFPLEDTKLPALCIYTKSEDTEYSTMTVPRTQMRVLEVSVEAYVKGTANLDNTLDTIAVEVEEALQTDLTRGGRAKDTQVTAFEADFQPDGEQTVSVGKFTVSVQFATIENDVETAV